MLNLIKRILKTLNQILIPYTNVMSKWIISKFKCRHKTAKHTHKIAENHWDLRLRILRFDIKGIIHKYNFDFIQIKNLCIAEKNFTKQDIQIADKQMEAVPHH